jgi:O-antigen ligase
MREISSKFTRFNIAIFFISVSIIGLFSSRILMSNGMIWFFGLLFVPGFLLKYKPFLAQLSLVFIASIGLFYTQDFNYALKILFTYSPFLFMPIAFGAINAFDKKQFILILYIYCGVVFISALIILINYFIHFDAMNEGLLRGHAIQTPYKEHIRYSLMLCFATCALIYMRIHNYFIWSQKVEKQLQLLLSFLLIVFIHVLSVRSGILSLYMCLFVIGLYLLFYFKKYFVGLSVFLALIILPILSYYTIPSIHNKISYMIWDLNQLRSNNSKNYSDSERIVSILAGVKIAKENILFGVGTGDIKNAMNKIYDKDYAWIDPNNRKMPHNQWVWLWASNGVLGVVAFAFSIIVSLVYKKNYKNLLLICFFIISISSFLYEHTLQVQVGVGFYILCLLIILNYLRGKEIYDENRI